MTLWGKRDDMVVHQTHPFNAEPPRTALARQQRTPLDTFYSRNHGPIPDVDADAWRLTVEGLVERPLTLSLDELRGRFEQHTLQATLQCAGNRRQGLAEVREIPGEDLWGPGATATTEWTGVRLGDVLRAAGVGGAAAHVEFSAPDTSELAEPPQPYGCSIPTAKALQDEVLLAWAMDGAPLPQVHGAPVRVVVPGYIGARSVKWVDRITVRAAASENWFQAVAYRVVPPEADPAATDPAEGITLGSIALNCDFLEPEDAAAVGPGPLDVTGYAFAGDDRTVARVDVSADGGRSWVQAQLERPAGPWTWQHWRATVTVSGPTTLLARAWDSTGALQPESPEHLWNPKGYANNSWARLRLPPSP